MVRKIFSGAVLLAAVCFAAQAQAAAINVFLTYTGSQDAAFNPIGTPLLNMNPTVAPTDLHIFEVSYSLTGMAANENFQALQFDVLLGTGMAPADFGGYVPSTPNFDPPGPAPPAPIYSTNADQGASTNDLQRIVVVANGTTGVTALMPGEGSPAKIGDIYLTWNGMFDGTNKSTINVGPNGLNPWGVYVDTVPTALGAETFSAGAEFSILGGGDPGEDPVVGDLNLVTTILHETVAGIVPLTDVDTLAFNDVNNPGWAPLIPGKPLQFSNLPTLDNAGNFSWNTAGALRGTYSWAITGTNTDGTDGGLITVQVTVPEPATFAMLGLAAVGLVGVIRRRS